MALKEALKQITDSYGRAVLSNPSLFTSLLLDYCPDEKKMISHLGNMSKSHSFDRLSESDDRNLRQTIEYTVSELSKDYSQRVVNEIEEALYYAFSLEKKAEKVDKPVRTGKMPSAEKEAGAVIHETKPERTSAQKTEKTPASAPKRKKSTDSDVSSIKDVRPEQNTYTSGNDLSDERTSVQLKSVQTKDLRKASFSGRNIFVPVLLCAAALFALMMILGKNKNQEESPVPSAAVSYTAPSVTSDDKSDQPVPSAAVDTAADTEVQDNVLSLDGVWAFGGEEAYSFLVFDDENHYGQEWSINTPNVCHFEYEWIEDSLVITPKYYLYSENAYPEKTPLCSREGEHIRFSELEEALDYKECTMYLSDGPYLFVKLEKGLLDNGFYNTKFMKRQYGLLLSRAYPGVGSEEMIDYLWVSHDGMTMAIGSRQMGLEDSYIDLLYGTGYFNGDPVDFGLLEPDREDWEHSDEELMTLAGNYYERHYRVHPPLYDVMDNEDGTVTIRLWERGYQMSHTWAIYTVDRYGYGSDEFGNYIDLYQ